MQPLSRKGLFTTGGAGAVALFVAACGGDDDKATPASSSSMSDTSDAAVKGDIAIVNYALTLEYLEADFYMQVIDSGVIKDKKIGSLAQAIGESEQQHVEALTATVKKLGGKPAAKPMTNFDAVLEGGPTKILETAADVENLGAAAYLGQAGRIKDKDILAAALSIHSVEARHAAALNELVGRGFKGSIPDGPFAKPMDMAAVLEAVQPFIAN